MQPFQQLVEQLHLPALGNELLHGREGDGLVVVAHKEVRVVAVLAELHQHVVEAPLGDACGIWVT